MQTNVKTIIRRVHSRMRIRANYRHRHQKEIDTSNVQKHNQFKREHLTQIFKVNTKTKLDLLRCFWLHLQWNQKILFEFLKPKTKKIQDLGKIFISSHTTTLALALKPQSDLHINRCPLIYYSKLRSSQKTLFMPNYKQMWMIQLNLSTNCSAWILYNKMGI